MGAFTTRRLGDGIAIAHSVLAVDAPPHNVPLGLQSMPCAGVELREIAVCSLLYSA